MGWQEINIKTYTAEIKRSLNLLVGDEIIEKDLLLTLILAEFEKMDLGKDLIFKGGTLLSRNYLKYHRFSEDLDFVYKDSSNIRELTRNQRERKIKVFLDFFTPKLKEVADALGLIFSINRSDRKFCKMLSGRVVYTFKLYYTDVKYIKVEINFVEKMIDETSEITIGAITDLFDSKKLLSDLNLSYSNLKVKSYSLKEITLEKYRAILTRNNLQERDLFDLFLIKDSLNADINLIVEKIKNSSLIKKDLGKLINEKLILLQQDKFFQSEEKVEEMAIVSYDKNEFTDFKQKIQPKLIAICKKFLEAE